MNSSKQKWSCLLLLRLLKLDDKLGNMHSLSNLEMVLFFVVVVAMLFKMIERDNRIKR